MATAHQSMQQGIQAIQAGQLEEGVRLLRFALKDATLKGRLRATALNWLGEVITDPAEKLRCFNEALDADPGNDFAEERLAELLKPPPSKAAQGAPPPPDTLPGDTTASPPPPPPTTLPGGNIDALVAPPPPMPLYTPPGTIRPATAPAAVAEAPTRAQSVGDYAIIGIMDGPNGPGSGFFLTTDGLVVTTRYVVGARESVTIELEPGYRQIAQVVRSFPDLDVALLKTEQTVRSLLPQSTSDTLAENAGIVIMPYRLDRVYGRRRETGRSLAPHLFPTDIVQVPDAGGEPVFDQRQQVVGMITRNISSSSAYVYGVHSATVRRCLDVYNYELRSVQNRVYCPSCGYASAAATVGGYYCETCGTVMPHAQQQTRTQTPNMAAFYGENTNAPCTQCGARAGFYDGLCLRCGRAGDPMR